MRNNMLDSYSISKTLAKAVFLLIFLVPMAIMIAYLIVSFR